MKIKKTVVNKAVRASGRSEVFIAKHEGDVLFFSDNWLLRGTLADAVLQSRYPGFTTKDKDDDFKVAVDISSHEFLKGVSVPDPSRVFDISDPVALTRTPILVESDREIRVFTKGDNDLVYINEIFASLVAEHVPDAAYEQGSKHVIDRVLCKDRYGDIIAVLMPLRVGTDIGLNMLRGRLADAS